jgi:DNA-binding transcriptional ArsR family regulator
MIVDRAAAETYAEWFRCLGDPTRIQILNLLADADRALTVRELVDKLEVGQPTVSHHLRQLERRRFIACERRGASTLVAVNERCLTRFPSAAAIVMGAVPAATSPPPWARDAA